MSQFLQNLYQSAVDLNHKNIFELFKKNPGARLLDLGCDDGVLSIRMAEAVGTKNIFGVEIVAESAAQARLKGITVKEFDINNTFDLEDNFFTMDEPFSGTVKRINKYQKHSFCFFDHLLKKYKKSSVHRQNYLSIFIYIYL